MSITEKLEAIEDIAGATHGFAVPGSDTLIDCLRPSTGKSWCFGQSLEEIQERYPGAEIVSIADFCRAKAARQDAPITWSETTEERYWDMLEVLPPACMIGTAFLVGEPWDHHAITGRARFAAYCSRDGKFLESSRPMQRSEFVALFKH